MGLCFSKRNPITPERQCPQEPLIPLSPLEPLEPLSPLEPLEALEPLESVKSPPRLMRQLQQSRLEPLLPLEPLEALSPLEALEALEPLEPLTRLLVPEYKSSIRRRVPQGSWLLDNEMNKHRYFNLKPYPLSRSSNSNGLVDSPSSWNSNNQLSPHSPVGVPPQLNCDRHLNLKPYPLSC